MPCKHLEKHESIKNQTEKHRQKAVYAGNEDSEGKENRLETEELDENSRHGQPTQPTSFPLHELLPSIFYLIYVDYAFQSTKCIPYCAGRCPLWLHCVSGPLILTT